MDPVEEFLNELNPQEKETLDNCLNQLTVDDDGSLKLNTREQMENKENEPPKKKRKAELFICDICGKSIKRKDNFIRHVKEHEKSFSFKECGKKFTRNYTLKQHVKSKHSQQSGGNASNRGTTSNESSEPQKDMSTVQNNMSNANGMSNVQNDDVHNSTLNTQNNDMPNVQNNRVHNNDVSNTHDMSSVHDVSQNDHRVSDESSLNGMANDRYVYPNDNDGMDLLLFFQRVQEETREHLKREVRRLHALKWYINIQVELEKEDKDGNVQSAFPHFRSKTYTFMIDEDFPQHDLDAAFQKIFDSFEKHLREGSNWTLKHIVRMVISTAKYSPIRGSSYIPLPTTLSRSQIVNIINDDEKCFLWSVLASIHPQTETPERVDHYKLHECELNMSGINYPVTISQVGKFEKQNNISVNVFGFEDKEIFPMYMTKQRDPLHCIDLLYLKQGKKSHYCIITSLNKFLSRTKSQTSTTHFCHFCLHGFIRKDLLEKHLEHCHRHDPQHVQLPEEGDNFLEFSDFAKTLKVPFVIYCDFECLAQKVHTCVNDPKRSSTAPNTKFEPCSFGYQVVCADDKHTKPPVVYRGQDVSKKFLECLLEEEKEILGNVKPLTLTRDEEREFQKSTLCYICRQTLDEKDRVRHHDHLTGVYYGACHNRCNLTCRQATFIPCILHNLKRFDAHIICEAIGLFKDHDIKCIPNNMEKYISFSLGNLRFIDSFQFMPQSLESLTENLAKEGISKFKHFSKEFSKEESELLLRKGVYPYEYVSSREKFLETRLPHKDMFYSQLSKSHISDDDYEHAQEVWEKMNIQSLGEYHDLYLKTDVLLLADVFENFRTMCLDYYGLDAAHYYTCPGLAWSAALKMTGVNLELLTDPDMYLFFESGVRGGISMISNKYAKANNPYVPETHDPSKPDKYILYTDCNNLYGKAMMEPLPIDFFHWLNATEIYRFDVCDIPKDGDMGYCLEVDLEYPAELHDLHSDYPLAPERKVVSDESLSPYSKQLWQTLHPSKHLEHLEGRVKTPKLVPSLENKTKYILHYRNLQLYLELGMKLTKIHRVLAFRQYPWLKKYIDFNSLKRKEAKNDFEKDFFKLMNNSVFGKTMENIRHRVNIELTQREKRLQKLVAKPSFKRFQIFNDNLTGVENAKVKLLLNKPVYTGLTILDLSKIIMYDFHYNYMRARYGDGAKLLFTDTDSLCYEIQTDGDLYKDMFDDRRLFDLSNYPQGHFAYDDSNKKVPGCFKDETGGMAIKEFVGLRSKMYSFTFANKEKQVAKGIAKSTIKKDLRHGMYKECLLDGKHFMCQMSSIRSDRHQLSVYTINKSGLCAFDDKRYVLPNGFDTLAFGHYRIKT